MSEENTTVTAFTDGKGAVSMRRILAFLLVLASIGFGILSIVLNKDWKVLLVATSVPVTAAIVLMFFTTWGDIAQVVDKVKK